MKQRKSRLALAMAPRILWSLAVVASSACGFPAVERTAVQTYVLAPGSSNSAGAPDAEMARARAGGKILLVSVPQATAGYDTARMIYLRRSQEVNYYAANQWADTPARMLHPLLVQALDRTGAFGAVVQMPSVVRGDYRLDAESLLIEQQFFLSPSRARLSLRAQLIDLKNLGVVATREFEILEEAPSEDAYGGVIAANRAASRLLDEIGKWLASLMAEIKRP